MHSVSKSRSPRPETENVVEAVRVLIGSVQAAYANNPVPDEKLLKNCILLLRRAPATRNAVLDTISACIERNVLRQPQFRDGSVEEMRKYRGPPLGKHIKIH